jgi:hypothetical protein
MIPLFTFPNDILSGGGVNFSKAQGKMAQSELGNDNAETQELQFNAFVDPAAIINNTSTIEVLPKSSKFTPLQRDVFIPNTEGEMPPIENEVSVGGQKSSDLKKDIILLEFETTPPHKQIISENPAKSALSPDQAALHLVGQNLTVSKQVITANDQATNASKQDAAAYLQDENAAKRNGYLLEPAAMKIQQAAATSSESIKQPFWDKSPAVPNEGPAAEALVDSISSKATDQGNTILTQQNARAFPVAPSMSRPVDRETLKETAPNNRVLGASPVAKP